MKTPDMLGQSARAWKFHITPEEAARKPHGLDCYLIHQPGVNVFWSWWVFTGCDLYDDPDPSEWGKLPPKKHHATATHEFLCLAISPESGHYAGIEPPDGWDSTDDRHPARVFRHFMKPAEFVHQEQLADNDQAKEIMRLFVKAVCDGHTAVDADFRRRNIQMLAATAEHFRQGKHEVI